jgi:hypothetical protein
MNIYTPIPVERSELVQPSFTEGTEFFSAQINGERRSGSWSGVEVKLVCRDERGVALGSVDSPWLSSHALVIKRQAANLLGTFLRDYGELLPLRCVEADLLVYNPTLVLDALDEGASDVWRSNAGRVIRINRHVFRHQVVEGADIFKIPNLRVSPVFLSHRAVKIWRDSGVTGIDFKEVWKS